MAAPRILLVEPEADGDQGLAERLRDLGLACGLARTGLEAWHHIAASRPDLIVIAPETPELDELRRRLRDEYMGRAPETVALASTVGETALNELGLHAVVLRPFDAGWLRDLVTALVRGGDELDAGRLREMLRLTTLGPDLQRALDRLAKRLQLIFGVSDAVVVANASGRQWVGNSSDEPVSIGEWPRLWRLCAEAIEAGAPLITEVGTTAQTRVAAAVRTKNREVVGAICLFANGARVFSADAREALDHLATRIGTELAWTSVHHRVAGERDQLRETAMYDPLLGVFSRAALDLALTSEIARRKRTRAALTLAVLDIDEIRVINDRYGHVVGDGVLRYVAQATRDLARGHDVVGRSGGDEIAVVMGDTAVAEARSVIGRIVQTLRRRPFVTPDGREIAIGARAGLAAFGSGDEDVAEWIARATEAADTAKVAEDGIAVAAGRGRSGASGREVRFEPGATLAGVYQIAHEISRGAMGVVYRAEDLGLSRPVAIKILRPDLVRAKGVVERFRGEAGVLASLSHDNLVRIHSFVEDRDDVFFVMELVEGVSLHTVINDFISRKRYLARERIAAIVSQVASALDAMHDAGLMHRDVKPSNVVLDRTRDRAVLVDVGLARKLGSRAEAAGTPGYVAPESFRGGTETPATDVYGLAATAYTLTVNRAPFGNADEVREILRRQIEEAPARPSRLRKDITSETDAVLARALSVEPASRHSTAGAFARALENSFAGVKPETDAPTIDHLPEYLESERSRSAAGNGTAVSTLTFFPALAAASRTPESRHTRGILFRTAARLLQADSGTGQAASFAVVDQDLAESLSSRVSPSAWISAELFVRLLESVDLGGLDRHAFAFELGSLGVQLSFRRFYPSSPESLSPQGTLSACDVLWRRYHSWGGIEVEIANNHEGMVTARESPTPFVCSFIRGWLTRVVTESGGHEPAVQHPGCVHNGARDCSFVVRWSN